MGGVLSLEVRWILPGELDDKVAEWFARYRPSAENRQDAYALRRDLGRLSVKIRAGKALEVKEYYGSPGILDVPGNARGRLELCRKWSFPVQPPGPHADQPAGWRTVGKRRRIARFLAADGQVTPGAPARAGQPGCAVELTEVRMHGRAWWSVGFEATGPATMLRTELEAAAAVVFATSLPGAAGLGLGQCQSYAQWLRSAAEHPGR